MIEKVRQVVERACKSPTNIFGYGIWTHHIVHIARYARLLARRQGVDPEIMELAALLHDYASIKDKALYEEHHLHSPKEAEKILKRLGYPKEKLDRVKQAILVHRGSQATVKRNKEAQILADADAIAHFESIPSLLYLAYAEWGKNIDEGAQWVRDKLERSWKKLSPTAKRIVREKYEACRFLLGGGSRRRGLDRFLED